MLVFTGLGALVADVVLEVPLSDECFNLILECDAFLLWCGQHLSDIGSACYGSFSSGLPASYLVACRLLCALWPRIHPHATLSG